TPRPAPERVAPPKDGAAKPAPPPKPAPRPAEFRPFNPDAVRPPAAPAPVARPQSLINRDLSWLQFNDRVLGEASNKSVPALERLRFAAIVSSNLDEFFMVRVAEIAKLARARPGLRYPDGLTAGRVLAQIREQVLGQ